MKPRVLEAVLLSTYELGRQPFGIASPAAWLRRDGHAVTCADLAVEELPEAAIASAGLIAFHLPMHTATRLATRWVERVRALNPGAHLCFYGLYAPVNEAYLRRLGGRTILGGEFEAELAALAGRIATDPDDATHPAETHVSLERLDFLAPDREGLPPLDRYAHVELAPGDRRVVGYTEATRGCKHRCRHCPVVPVYDGRFRVVPRDVVLEDIRRQLARGAEHVTFGDPDFLNGPAHAARVVEALHREHPELTYDVTIKIEHLLRHDRLLPVLRDTGCLFVTSAVESLDDRVLAMLDKGHTRQDFLDAVARMREVGLALNPTFVTFTPWTTLEGYVELLETLLELELADHVAPVQYAIRLLIPGSSRLLELDEVRKLVGPFDGAALVHPWKHPDPRVDLLFERVTGEIHEGQRKQQTRRQIFGRVWETARRALDGVVDRRLTEAALSRLPARASVPFLTEPWYC